MGEGQIVEEVSAPNPHYEPVIQLLRSEGGLGWMTRSPSEARASAVILGGVRQFRGLLVATALGVTACSAATVPGSTDPTVVTDKGFVQIERQAPAAQPPPVERPAGVVKANPTTVDQGSSRSPELPPKIVPPSPADQPGSAQTGRPGGDRCSRGGSGDPKELLPMCIAQ